MKKKLLIMISVFLCISVVNAAPIMEWEKTYKYGDSDLNVFTDTVTNQYNEHYAVGYYRYDTGDGNADYNAMIVKYDKDGNMIWEKSFDDGNGDFENFVAVETLSDGGAVAVGYFDFVGDRDTILSSSKKNNSKYNFKSTSKLKNNDSVFKTPVGMSMFVFRFDRDGKIVWSNPYDLGGLELYSFEEFNNLLVDSKDNIYVIPNSGYMNIFKIDKDGNEVWTKEISEEDTKETDSKFVDTFVSPYDIKIDKDDNLVVAIEKETITINYDTGENSDIFEGIIRKYDSNGKLLFEKSQRVDDKNTMFVLLEIDNDNNYQVIGYVEDPDNELDSYPMVFKYDKNGSLIDKRNIKDMFEDIFIADDLFHTEFFIDKSNNYLFNYSFKNDGVYAIIDSRRFNTGTKDWILTSSVKDKLLFKGYIKNNAYFYVGSTNITKGDEEKYLDFMNDCYIMSINNSDAYIAKYSDGYKINKEIKGEGTIEVNLDNAKAGDEITIEAKAAPGYRIDNIIVTDKDGNIIKVSGNKFVMPNSDVTVKVIFTNSPLVNPKTGAISITFAVIAISVYAFFQYKYFKNKEINL